MKTRAVKNIIKMGNSVGITLPKEIANMVEVGETCVFDIKLLDIINRAKSYRCMACSHHFDTDDNPPYCPACDNNIVTEIKDE